MAGWARGSVFPLAASLLAGCGATSEQTRDAGREEMIADAAASDRAADTRAEDRTADGPAPASDAKQSVPVLPDAGAPDLGSLFAGCPGPEAYAGNPAWRDELVIAPAFQVCADWRESDGTLDRTSTVNRLKDTLARKVVATIAPGRYKLPDAPGQAPFGLPICLVHPDQKPLATGTGTIARRMAGAVRIFDISVPIPAMGLVRGSLVREGSGPLSGEDLRGLQRCPDAACAFLSGTFLGPCTFEGPPTTDTVTLENGMVELTVVFGRTGIGAGTEPGFFARARGSYQKVAFDQRDYFKLIYSPEHHHFTRHYAVLFDAPIAGACGLELVNLPGGQAANSRPVKAFAVDCQLGRMAEVKVTGVP
jgi:hypothetical protein